VGCEEKGLEKMLQTSTSFKTFVMGHWNEGFSWRGV
jgi:hypothetical protein